MPEPIEDHVVLAELTKEDRLARMRHSAAHVLAEAMVELMPEVELGIGPSVDNGFYYDFKLPRPLLEEELKKLQKRMRKSLGRKLDFKMESITRAEGEATWKGQRYKLEMLADIEDGVPSGINGGLDGPLVVGGHEDVQVVFGVHHVHTLGLDWNGWLGDQPLQRTIALAVRDDCLIGEQHAQVPQMRVEFAYQVLNALNSHTVHTEGFHQCAGEYALADAFTTSEDQRHAGWGRGVLKRPGCPPYDVVSVALVARRQHVADVRVH